MNLKPRLSSLLLALVAAVVLAGCVNAAGASLSVSAIIFLIALLGLGIAACTGDTQSDDNGWNVGRDVGTEDASEFLDVRDVRDEEGGTWETCCEDGQVSSCHCPANTSCNFGRYVNCGDGTCSYDPNECADPVDAGDADDVDADDADTGPDADGTWQPCCIDGVVDSCFCPSDSVCNYGWYEDCGGGTCSMEPDGCKEPDAGM